MLFRLGVELVGPAVRTLLLSAVILFTAGVIQSAVAQPTSIMWQDLVPFEDDENGNKVPLFGMEQVIEELNNQEVRIPGYIVPLSYEADNEHSDFLFVPYIGACIHVPPPPPNQIIYVTSSEPVDIGDLWTPFYVNGVLQTKKNVNALGPAAYTLELGLLELYEE